MARSRTLEALWSGLPHWTRSLLTALVFGAVLNLFFVSIGLLSAFKALGSGYGQQLIVSVAANPLVGLVVGILVTSIVQSSSSTTSLVVGLVAAGTLGEDPAEAVRIAIPIIMGANIGTSVTNILVSFGQIGDRRSFERAFSAATVHDIFNLLSVLVLLPLQVMTNFLGKLSMAATQGFSALGGLKFASPLKLLVKPQQKALATLIDQPGVASFVIGVLLIFGMLYGVTHLSQRSVLGKPVGLRRAAFAVLGGLLIALLVQLPGLIRSTELATLIVALTGLFGALYLMVAIMKAVVLTRIERLFHDYIFKTPVRALVVGIVFTALVQSSSATTSLIVPLAGAGLLTLEQVFPYTLGANIGTTVTAMLAALSLGQPAAVAVATAHLLFNIFGIVLFYPLRRLPLAMARKLGELCLISPLVAPAFVGGVFFVLPLLLIFLMR